MQRVKQERHSEPETDYIREVIYVKDEPRSEPESESDYPEPDSDPPGAEDVEKNKKTFKRIVPFNDNSDTDSEAGKEGEGGKKKKKRFKRVKPFNDDSDPSSPEPVVRNKRGKKNKKQESSEESEDFSSSGSSSEKSVPMPKRRRKEVEPKQEPESEDEVPADSGKSSESGSSSSESTKGEIEFESTTDDDWGSDKSYTSSESDHENFTDDLRICCLVCKNLGSRTFRGRSKQGNRTGWCKCGECVIVGRMKDYDRICCREIKDLVVFLDDEMEDASEEDLCITKHPRFELDVLDQKALNRSRYYRTDFYGNSDSYMAAWSFIRWIWDKVGWGNRMVIPACVARRIKEKFGINSLDCFTAVKTCLKGKHCVESQKS